MMHRLGPAASAALFGALSGIALLALFYVTSPALQIDFAVDPPRLMTGIYSGERDDATRLTFAWTGPDVALRLPGLDRRVPWSVDIRVRGGRQAAADNPVLTFFVDGVRVLDYQSETGFATVQFVVPPRIARPRGALITMQCSRTFVPGPQDPRPLGVMFDVVTVRPDGFALPPREAFTAAALSGAALGAAIGFLGMTPGLAIGAAVLLSAGQTACTRERFRTLHGFSRPRRSAGDRCRRRARIRCPGHRTHPPAAPEKHCALCRDVHGGGALPETARSFPPEHADRRRTVPRASFSRGPARQLLLHVDRPWELSVSVRARPLCGRASVRPFGPA